MNRHSLYAMKTTKNIYLFCRRWEVFGYRGSDIFVYHWHTQHWVLFFFVRRCFFHFVCAFRFFFRLFQFQFPFQFDDRTGKKRVKTNSEHSTVQKTSTNRNVDVITRQRKRHPNNCAFEYNTCSKCDRWWLMSSQKPIANGIFSRYILFDVNCE